MTGRKKPEMTEAEKEHEYLLQQKRSHGDAIVGTGGEFLDHVGGAAEVMHKRAAWHKEHDQRHEGLDKSRPDDS